jgi:hypothetical protein
MDHVLANQETKDAVCADLKQRGIALLEADLKENSDLYRQLPDGRWDIVR